MLTASLLLLAATQSPSTEWMDRISHDSMLSKGPLPARPVHHTLYMGVLGLYETNVNLEDSDEDAESIVVPFLRLRLEYADRQVDAAADVLANWKQYIPDGEFSDEEERVYGRIRYISPKLELELAEIFQHVSDPVDVVYAHRVDRFVSDTIGHGRLEIFSGFAVEADVDAGIVRFQEKTFDEGDNTNLRAGLGLAAKITMGLEAVAQAGVLLIDYRYKLGAPPDVEGGYLRAGVRGDLLPQLALTLLLGAARASSDDFDSGAEGVEDATGEAALHLRWAATEKLTVYGDYSREFVFGAGPEPYQLLNRLVGLAEYEASSDVRIRGRLQFDHADGALGVQREWMSVGGSVQWQTHEQVFFDAGLEFLWGGADGSPADYNYDDMIVHFGVVVTN